MPWHVAQSSRCPSSKPWAVIKDSDSSIEGCHETQSDANKQLAALYANESNSYEPRLPGMPCLRRGLPLIRDTVEEHCQGLVPDCFHQCLGSAGHGGDCYD